jgi:hypothetical protein
MSEPKDRNGNLVRIGTHVRLIALSGRWLDELPDDERVDVISMVGEVLEVEEIDEDGRPWIRKSWPDGDDGSCYGHSIALDPDEMEVVNDTAA